MDYILGGNRISMYTYSMGCCVNEKGHPSTCSPIIAYNDGL